MTLPVRASELIGAMGLVRHPEGGYFLETYRSGTAPMLSRGLTALNGACAGTDRKNENNDGMRNWMTSIYWCCTTASPILRLAINKSDHVHYWHGGTPFVYILVDPDTGILTEHVLGPDVVNGQVLQLVVRGGTWKAGRILSPEKPSEKEPDYCLLGEAVSPGFDFRDLTWVTGGMVRTAHPSLLSQLMPFIKEPKTLEEIDGYYDKHDKRSDLNGLSQ